MKIEKIREFIETTLNKNKANNIISIDLKEKSYIADYMIIASGTSSSVPSDPYLFITPSIV